MLLYYSIVTLHVIVCVILVLVVLLQSGKGADLAGAFGGGATQTAFGSRGPASFLSKMTTVAAIVFMLTSISLSLMTTRASTGSKSILETTKGADLKTGEKRVPGKSPACAYAGTDPEGTGSGRSSKSEAAGCPGDDAGQGRASGRQTGRIQAACQVVDLREEFRQEM